MKNGFSKWLRTLLAIAMTLGCLNLSWIQNESTVVRAAPTDAPPATSKRLIDNGDGTYTLALSVTGATESSSTTQVTKANVILVVDTSNSMNNGSNSSSPVTYTPVEGTPSQNSGTHYGVDENGNYFQLYYRNGQWRITNGNNAQVYNGTFYIRTGGNGLTRIEAEKDALIKSGGIIDNLLSQNVPGDSVKSDIIEVAIANFGGAGTTAQTFTTNAATLKNTINGLTTSTGTNWEEGLMRAQELATSIKASQPNEDVYVIFLTDGEPTTHDGDHSVNTNYAEEWGYASDNARAIVTAGYIFYGLFTWGSGNSSHYLSSLVQYAYTGSGNSNTGLSSTYAKYFSDASDTETLIAALNQIVHDITTGVGYTNVELEDGVTQMTTSSVKATAGGEVTGVKYYRSGGSYSTTANGGLGEEWAGAPHAVINDNGEVDWSLGNIVLENGVTYTIAFTVWPSQESIDLVADLNNGIIDYDSLTADQKSQIAVSGSHYTLKTNTDYPEVTYSTVTTTTVDGETTTVVSEPQTATITNPDPVGLVESKLNAVKSWDDSLDPSQREEIEDVILYLLVDGHYYYVDSEGKPLGVTLTEESGWTITDYINIAPGLMVTSESAAYPGDDVAGMTYVTWNGTKYALLERGHEYVFEESDINNHFELTAYTHHPMIMGANIVDVVFTKDDAGNITGIESVSELGDNLSATNTLKPGINIQKKVVDENNNEIDNTDSFEVTVYVVDAEGNALPTKTTADGKEYTIDYRIYYGKNNPNYDAASGGGRSGHIYKTGTSFVETLYIGDVIRVVNVEAEALYRVEETAPFGYALKNVAYEISVGSATDFEDYADGSAVTIGGKTYYPLVGNAAAQATVINTYTYGALKIEKTVVGHANDTDFEFTVNLYSDSTKATALDRTYNYTKTTSAGTSTGTITNGGKLTLRGGESLVIEKLPEGAYYTVTETAKSGYETSVKNVASATTYTKGNLAEGTIVKDAEQYAGFQNIYSANGSDTFTGTKTLTGRKMKANDVFEFTLNAGGTDLGKVKANVTAGENTVDIAYPGVYFKVDTKATSTGWSNVVDADGYTTQIIYTVTDAADLADSYSFTIAEENKQEAGITYAATAVTADVPITVTDNNDGTITVTVDEDKIVYKDSTGATISGGSFTNTYEATGSFTPEVTKVLTGRTLVANQFEFQLTGTDITEAMTAKNTADGKVSFGTITYDQDDAGKTFTYQIKEVNAGAKGYTYDTMTVTVTVAVADKGDGTLDVTVTYPTDTEFNNSYEAKGDVTFSGNKSITGREMTSNDVFTFEITDGTNTWTVENDSTGKIAYPKIEYVLNATKSDVGTHTYTVKETSTDGNGIKVATNTYEVTVTVSDNGDGTLKVETSSNATALNFVNTYEASGTFTPEVTKVLTGRTLEAGQFTFELTGTGITGSKTATNDANGKVTFETITYTQADVGKTFEYVINEVDAGAKGYTYETTPVTVSVVVTDNGDGTLTATPTYSADKTFNNTYTASGEFIPEVTKVLTGRTLEADQFEFQLTGTGITEAMAAKNTADGKVTFGKITYDQDDAGKTFTYQIKEVNKGADGYTYDGMTVTVTVEVKDNGDGTLTATAKYPEDTEFNNTYVAEGSFVPSVTKALTGRTLEAEQFEFQLTGDGISTAMTAKNAADGTVTFDAITYNQDDVGKTFTYEISEVKGEEGKGYTYDEMKVTVTVTVADQGNGKLTATASYSSDTEFNNTYEATGNITFEGTKSIDSRELTANDVFTFTVTEGTTVIAEVTNDSTGKIAYPTIDYVLNATKSDLGEHTYTVKETSTDGNGITVATNTYTVTVNVTDNGDGTLNVEASDNAKTLDFVNTYVAEGSITFEGTKSIDSRDLTEDDVFTFTVKEGDTVIGTGQNDETGEITYPVIEYVLNGDKSDLGEHTYTITETSTDGNGITVSTKEYTVTVNVTDDTKGNLIAEITSADKKFDFVNTYEAEGSITFEGTKSIDSRDLTEDDVFKFTVKEGDKVIAEVTNDTNGKIAYPEIKYVLNGEKSDLGEHTYTITETSTDGNGITVSTKEYTVTVEVTDNKDGTLTAEITSTDKKFDFINTYEAKGSIVLSGTKTLTGKTIEDDMFEFTLSEGDKVLETVKNKDGKVTFTALEYVLNAKTSDLGEHVYTIKETVANEDGYIYDTKTVTATVTVEDNKDGTLNVTVSYDGAETFSFANEYKETSLTVNKIWDDNDDQDGYRPSTITLQLLKDGKPEGDKVTVRSADNGDWTYTFNNLPAVKNNGTEIVYEVEETQVPEYNTPSYEKEEDGSITITNTHNIEKVEITVKKFWKDNDNQDGKRPESITVVLLADGVETEKTLVITGTDWTGKFTDLDKKANGKEITYTVKEKEVAEYTTEYSENTLEITNIHEIETTSITVNKVWSDKDDQDKIRPESVQIQLYANGEKSGDAISLSEGNKWTYTWEKLPQYKAGKKLSYTVEEVTVPTGYTVAISGDEQKGYTVTNTHTPNEKDVTIVSGGKTISVDGAVVAAGDEISYSITYANNTDKEATVTVKDTIPANTTYVEGSAGDGVYADGVITWTIDKVAAGAGGTVSFKVTVNDDANGASITNEATVDDGVNKFDTNVTTISIPEKESDVIEAAEVGTEITYTVVFDLTKDAESLTITDVVPAGTEFVSATNGGVEKDGTVTWTFTSPKAQAYKVEMTVKVTADAVEYDTINNTATVKVNDNPEVKTNEVEDKVKTIDVAVEKQWDDEDDKDGLRPESITITLLADGTEVATAELKADKDGRWYHEFTKLPTKTEDGKEITYTVEEKDVPAGYAVTVEGDYKNGLVVTNTHAPYSVEYDPPVKKVIVGEPEKDETFTFKMEAKSTTVRELKGKMPMPEAANGSQSMTVTITGEGEEEFGWIVFEKPGEYTYEISEVDGKATGYSYDATVYKIVFVITENEDKTDLIMERTIYENKKVVDKAVFEFTNRYEPDIPYTGDSNNLKLWYTTYAISVTGALGTALYFFKKRKEEE